MLPIGAGSPNRLYHQLTGQLLECIAHPLFTSGIHLVRMYDNFVRFFESDINQTDLIEFCIAASKQYEGRFFFLSSRLSHVTLPSATTDVGFPPL